MQILHNEEKLERRIGFWGLLAMSVGVNIGGSLFALTGLAASLSGPSLPIALLISATPVVLALAPFCILSLIHPTTSASYRYGQLVNPSFALAYLITVVICMGIGGMPLFALVVGMGLEPIISISPTITGVLALSIFYVINLLGVALTSRIQLILSLILIIALVTFVFTGVPNISMQALTPLFPNGFGGTLVAAGLLFTFCAGGLFVVDVGGEVINPHRNLPGALAMGMAIALILYLGIMFVTIGAVDWSTLQGKSLVDVAADFMSANSLTFFIIGGAVVASATTINAVFTLQARLILVVAEEGLISQSLGSINSRYGTPHWALTLVYVLSVTALVSMPSIRFFGSMLNLVMILAVTLVTCAALKIAVTNKELLKRSAIMSASNLKKICVVIITMNVMIFSYLAVDMGWSALAFAGILAGGYGYSRFRKNVLANIQAELESTWSSL
jgi:APA family basic amino acid/polyamine antiporter